MLSIIVLPVLAAIATASPMSDAWQDAKAAVQQAQQTYTRNTQDLLRKSHTGCIPAKVRVRKAWDDLTKPERQDYLRSVQCLVQKRPSRLDTRVVPGARTWADDFTWSHLIQSNFMHQSALLLPWHRQFIWAYEETLRNQCGYRGALPYWAWERHSADQARSPVFQPDSFGANGVRVPNKASVGLVVGLPNGKNVSYPTPAGTGGGCVKNGAFKDLVLNIGPLSRLKVTKPNSDSARGSHYNPRCLVRNFSPETSIEGLTYGRIRDLLSKRTIREFHPLLEDKVHPSSHTYIGGEGLDFYSSPNDPVFFLLHAQIDRLWSIWQGLDYPSRRLALDGTVTFMNIPPSKNGTLSTVMHMGVAAGGDMPISQAMSTIENRYCYMYA